jgi:spermidine synthase
MPRWLAATRPGSRSTVLEVDRAVVRLGRESLGVGEIPGLRVVTGDARTSLRALPDDSADLVVGDAFGSLSVPWHLATREFLTDVSRVLRPGGLVVLNVIDNGPKRLLAAEARTLASVLDSTALVARPEQLGRDGGGNFVLAASDARLAPERIRAATAARAEPAVVLTGRAYDRLAAAGPLLTDDHAPVDQLLTPYRRP